MPPKKQSKKSSKNKSDKSAKADDFSSQDALREQLEKQLTQLHEDVKQERQERTYFQHERDKIHTFWEVTKEQLKESEATIRAKDEELQQVKESVEARIKGAKHNVTNLLQDQKEQLEEVKTKGVIAAKFLEKEQTKLEQEIHKDMRRMKVEMMQQQRSYVALIKNINMDHAKEISKIRNEFETKVEEIETRYKKKMQMEREEQDLRRKTEIHELKQSKDSHIVNLIKNHDTAFTDLKTYFQEITVKSVNTIKSLKAEVADLKSKEERLQNKLSVAQKQYQAQEEPLRKALEEIAVLQKKLRNYESYKASLEGTRKRLIAADKELKDLKLEDLLLEHMHHKVEQEREELQKELTKVTQNVQQKSSFKNLLLQKKVDALKDMLEKKEAQLSEIFDASDLNPETMNIVTRNLEELIDSKNTAIKDLQYELARTRMAHNDLLRICEVELKACGIPTDQLKFKPLESSAPLMADAGVQLPNCQACQTIRKNKKACREQVEMDDIRSIVGTSIFPQEAQQPSPAAGLPGPQPPQPKRGTRDEEPALTMSSPTLGPAF